MIYLRGLRSPLSLEAHSRQRAYYACAYPPARAAHRASLREEIGTSTPLGPGPALLRDIDRIIDLLEQKLAERSELQPIPKVFEHDAQPARHAILRLQEYFAEGPRDCFDAEDARAFLAYPKSKVDALRDLARESDETYASPQS